MHVCVGKHQLKHVKAIQWALRMTKQMAEWQNVTA